MLNSSCEDVPQMEGTIQWPTDLSKDRTENIIVSRKNIQMVTKDGSVMRRFGI